MYPDSSEGLNKETEDSIYFFTVSFEPLNNWSAHLVHIWDKDFSTAEQAFQWKKFSVVAPQIANKILLAKSPYAVFKISSANKNKQPSDWSEKKLAVMEEILRAKTEQHEDVQDALRRTKNRIIIENSPVDSFWGIGQNGDGQSMLGNIWMKIRNEL
jgi:N-glycosidase YbiA